MTRRSFGLLPSPICIATFGEAIAAGTLLLGAPLHISHPRVFVVASLMTVVSVVAAVAQAISSLIFLRWAAI